MINRTQAGIRSSLWGLGSNLALAAVKLTAGFLTQSQGMIADGFNSAGDVFASLVTLLGSHAAGKPEDSTHPFGHGKAEYLASLLIGLSMLVVAGTALWSALSSLALRETLLFSPWLPAIAAVTVAVKLALYLYTRHYARRFDSLLILANAEDHRNDMLITLGTLTGILATGWGLWWVDGAIGILISLWIAHTGIRILYSAARVLMDTSIDKKMEQHLVNHILEIPQVSHIDSVSSLPVGARYVIIVKLSVPPEMTVAESHKIAGVVRALLTDHNDKIADAVIHVNPDFPHDSPVRAQRESR